MASGAMSNAASVTAVPCPLASVLSQSTRLDVYTTEVGVASRFHGRGQFRSHQTAEALEAVVDNADLDALALEACVMPRGRAVQSYALADHCALVGLRRDDGPDADDAFLSRSIGQQRHRHISFDVVDADVARGCTALFEVVPYVLGVAFV